MLSKKKKKKNATKHVSQPKEREEGEKLPWNGNFAGSVGKNPAKIYIYIGIIYKGIKQKIPSGWMAMFECSRRQFMHEQQCFLPFYFRTRSSFQS